jgi:hypothetical protein
MSRLQIYKHLIRNNIFKIRDKIKEIQKPFRKKRK